MEDRGIHVLVDGRRAATRSPPPRNPNKKNHHKRTVRYDMRQKEYEAIMADVRRINPKVAGGFRRPGSWNSKKLRTG